MKQYFFACACGAAFLAAPAHAITQTSGFVETSGVNSTIDLWYFTLDFDLITGVQVDPRAGVDPLTTENVSVLLYENDGVGGLGSLLAQAGAPAPLPGNARVELALTAGDYVVALSAFDLLPAEVGSPFQSDSTVPLSFEYELTLDQAGGNDARFTCSVAGNLDGSFTRADSTFDQSANCRIPAAQINEAPSLALFAAMGLIGAALIGRRGAL
ncbi:MAG: hypothetical protein AAF221_08585 [Pseudomonadota bacterium]